MNQAEHLLACLAEECCEIAKEAHKAQRFGLDDKVTLDPAGPRGTEGPTNRDKIVTELNDLMGVIAEMELHGLIPTGWQDAARQRRKVDRVRDYMKYAQRVGALQPPEEGADPP